MIFNKHSRLVGAHAFLSASKHSWTNYDDHKLEAYVISSMAAARGTALHQLANDLILLGVPLPDAPTTMNLYVNDALGYRMDPEVVLYYSDNCFGTVDAICFRNNVLRIHDLKTGIGPTSFKQLMVYAAIFCLEYDFKPVDILMELRIYQNDDVKIVVPDPHDITQIMSTIVAFDKQINEIREENAR